MPPRSCCCTGGGGGGGGPCDCQYGSYAPPLSSPAFSYEVDFSGYTGKLRVQKEVTNTNQRLRGVPGTNNPGIPGVKYGGVFCLTNPPGSFGVDVECGNDCGGFEYTVCGAPVDPVTQFIPVFAFPNLVIEESEAELTTYLSGTVLTEETGVNILAYIAPIPYACPNYYSRSCVNGECVRYGACSPCVCSPTAVDEQEGECLTPTFWEPGTDFGCWPMYIPVMQTLPGLQLSAINDTSAVLQANWDGVSSSWSFSSNSPWVQIVGYRHRRATTAECFAGGTCTSQPLSDAGNTYTNCDEDDDCCCQSEIVLSVNVRQSYQRVRQVAIGQRGVIGSPTLIQNQWTATYRGCDDPTLYEPAAIGKPSREFTLQHVKLNTLGVVDPSHLVAAQFSQLDNYLPVQRCNFTLIPGYSGFGPLDSFKATTIVNLQDNTDYACDRPAGNTNVRYPAAIAKEWGFPGTLMLTRITP